MSHNDDLTPEERLDARIYPTASVPPYFQKFRDAVRIIRENAEREARKPKLRLVQK